jgi:hypothetical protein
MLRQLARVPAAFADLAARDGKCDDALRYIGLSFRLAECTRDPLLVGLLVRIALVRFGTGAVCELVERCGLSEVQARRAFDLLGSIDLEPQQVSALLGERAFGIWMADVANRPGVRAAVEAGAPVARRPGLRARIGAYFSRPFTYADGICYLRLMEKEIDSAHVPFRELGTKGLDADSLEKETPFYATMARTLIPVFPRVRMQTDTCIAETAGARAALALIAYKDHFGSYPGSLAEVTTKLGWKLPEDPFSGKDFIYKPQAKGFIVYSIGPNLKDDGGVAPRERDNIETKGDIVISRNR